MLYFLFNWIFRGVVNLDLKLEWFSLFDCTTDVCVALWCGWYVYWWLPDLVTWVCRLIRPWYVVYVCCIKESWWCKLSKTSCNGDKPVAGWRTSRLDYPGKLKCVLLQCSVWTAMRAQVRTYFNERVKPYLWEGVLGPNKVLFWYWYRVETW